MKEKVVFCWSGGKDSALALNRIVQDDRYDVIALLTTCNEHFQRVSMHGVRLELLERQAKSIALPLEKIFVGQHSSNEEYQQKMSACLLAYREQGATACVFGDIFLEDLKQWREQHLALVGMRGIFPLWKIDSRELAREFIALGFGSVLCCVNDAYFDEHAVGRCFDEDFVNSLPDRVDPCGENGEFHSFAFKGPVFQQPVPFKVGQKVYRPLEVTHPNSSNSSHLSPSDSRQTKGFWFCDLLPTEAVAMNNDGELS
jgi:uncharacterized protein (TIGR00290 family)